jgi:putative tryptophan/tyrosine transport system substrate-binding protein
VTRRDLIALLGSTVAAWPLGVRAQQPKAMRHIGVMMSTGPESAVAQTRLAAFMQGLQELGWAVGRNVRVEIRWPAGDAERIRRDAVELVALAPDVIVATGSATAPPLLHLTRTLPIVFVIVPDPVGAGIVDSLARPGGNATGFTTFEYSIGGKWLELLREIAPAVTRAAVIRDSAITAGIGQWAAIHSMAPSLGMEVVPVNVRDPVEIEGALTSFSRSANGGMIVTGSALALTHLNLIIALAARLKLPAVFSEGMYVVAGGLISYAPNSVEQYRQAAGYVDRILRGEKPADLPVQAPTRYELVINLKTARALGLDVPPALLARADEVIE